MVRSAEGIALALDGQPSDPLDLRDHPTVLLFRHRIAARLARSAHDDRHLRAFRQEDVAFEHNDAVFDATANDHIVIFGRMVRQHKLQWGRGVSAAEGAWP